MKKECQDIISKELGVQPIRINSNLVSAQNRDRLYWTNIPNIEQPKDKGVSIQQILEQKVDHKYYCNSNWLNWWNKYKEKQLNRKYSSYCNLNSKAICLVARQYVCWAGNFVYYNDDSIRKLSHIECERLQTLPDNYTNYASDTQRYKMLGNCWTVDVVAHIFKFISKE